MFRGLFSYSVFPAKKKVSVHMLPGPPAVSGVLETQQRVRRLISDGFLQGALHG